MSPSVIRRLTHLAILGLAVSPSCSPPADTAPGSGPELAENCTLLPGPVERGGRITIGLEDDAFSHHAPTPENETERVLFRQLYETLVEVDCRGTVRPGLARSWHASEEGRVWHFDLRPNARFSDGSRLTGESVRRAWSKTRVWQHTPIPWVWVNPDSIRTLGEDALIVALSEGREDPSIFAHRSLAVVKSAPGADWLLGSGPYQVSVSEEGDGIELRPNRFNPAPGNATLFFRVGSVSDPRDLLDAGVDVVMARDRSTRVYAERFAAYAVHPLAWDRLYVLASPDLVSTRVVDGLRAELSRDVLQEDSRPAGTFSFAGDAVECDSPDPPRSGSSRPLRHRGGGSPRIVYARDDKDGGRVSGRLVALASAPEDRGKDAIPLIREAGTVPVAAGLDRASFDAALAWGSEWAFVFYCRPTLPDPCLEADALFQTVGWLWCAAGGCTGGPAPAHPSEIQLQHVILPLAVTRPYLVAHREISGIRLDWDGTPLFGAAGWSKGRALP